MEEIPTNAQRTGIGQPVTSADAPKSQVSATSPIATATPLAVTAPSSETHTHLRVTDQETHNHLRVTDQAINIFLAQEREQDTAMEDEEDQGVNLWQTVGSAAPRNSQHQGENFTTVIPVNNSGVDNLLIMEFLDDGINNAKFITKEMGICMHLLNTSPFKGLFEGTGLVKPLRNELFLTITDKEKIPQLLTIVHLEHEPTRTKFPIKCRLPDFTSLEPDHSYGELKNVSPHTPEFLIKEDIERQEINKTRGINVLEVKRQYKKFGGVVVPKYSLKIKFSGPNPPKEIFYGGIARQIHPYVPNFVICAKCSKSGHVHKYCNNELRCGKCGGNHDKRTCTKGNNNHLEKRCPNCSKQHSAAYGGCQYVKVEKKVALLHATHKTPRFDLRKTLWAEVAANNNNPNTTRNNAQSSSQAGHSRAQGQGTHLPSPTSNSTTTRNATNGRNQAEHNPSMNRQNSWANSGPSNLTGQIQQIQTSATPWVPLVNQRNQRPPKRRRQTPEIPAIEATQVVDTQTIPQAQPAISQAATGTAAPAQTSPANMQEHTGMTPTPTAPATSPPTNIIHSAKTIDSINMAVEDNNKQIFYILSMIIGKLNMEEETKNTILIVVADLLNKKPEPNHLMPNPLLLEEGMEIVVPSQESTTFNTAIGNSQIPSTSNNGVIQLQA